MSAHHSPDRQHHWNERYAAAERVWSHGPNELVAQIIPALAPAATGPQRTALDLGAGEGRHTIWLAEQGWHTTAVDFAEVGLDRGRREAEARGLEGSIDWVTADVTTWNPPSKEGKGPQQFDLVLIAYLHLPQDVFGRAATWVAPGGHLVAVGHALRNLTDGAGGPQDPALLHSPDQLREKADALEIVRCEEVERTTAGGATAIDVVLVARR